MIEFNFSIIQWHSNSEIIIGCGSSKHLFFCCICYFQWPSENCPLHSFIACWSCQTAFVSENRVSSVTSKRMRKSHMKIFENQRAWDTKISCRLIQMCRTKWAPFRAIRNFLRKFWHFRARVFGPNIIETHRKNSSKSSLTISPSLNETFAPSPASSAWFRIRSKFVSSSALKELMTHNVRIIQFDDFKSYVSLTQFQ